MEGHAGSLATGAGTSGALALTGFNTIAYIVAGLTLLFAGLALLKLVPRLGRSRRSDTLRDRCTTRRRPFGVEADSSQDDVSGSCSASCLRRV
jgi:hypothetical protein